MSRFTTLLVLLISCQCAYVCAHSWLECVKLLNPTIVTSLADMNCLAYPAGYVGRIPNPDDNMYKVEGITQAQWLTTPCCKTATRTYLPQYPMLTLKAGEFMTFAYTPNGHTTWSPGPPNYGPKDFYVKWTPQQTGTSMVTMSDMYNATTLYTTQFDTPCHVRTTGAQVDASSGICNVDITIPADTQPGKYMFVWWWPFRNSGGSSIEDYLNCWDVEVQAASSSTGGTPTNAPTNAPITVKPTSVQPTSPISVSTTGSSVPFIIGEETSVNGQDLSTNSVAAIIVIPAIIIVPLIGLYVAAVLDKTKPLGKVDHSASKIRLYFTTQAIGEAGQYSAQLQRVLVVAVILGLLEVIWAALSAAFTSGILSAVAITSAVVSVAVAVLGLYAGFKRKRPLLIFFIAAAVISALIQAAFIALVIVYYSELSKMDEETKNSFNAVTGIFTLIVVLQIILMPINFITMQIAWRVNKAVSSYA